MSTLKIEIICGLDLDKITAAVSTPPAAPIRVTDEMVAAYKAAYRQHTDACILGFIPSQTDGIIIEATRRGIAAALSVSPSPLVENKAEAVEECCGKPVDMGCPEGGSAWVCCREAYPKRSTPQAAPVTVPEGWQLVPTKPTKSQYEAAWGFREIERANGTIQPDWTWTCGQIYQAMLSASPSPVDSRDRLIERLEDAVRIYLEVLDSNPEKDVLDEDGVSFASDWSHQKHDAEVAAALDDVRAALAAKEQQP